MYRRIVLKSGAALSALDLTAGCAGLMSSRADTTPDIVDTAVAAGAFNTLVAAVPGNVMAADLAGKRINVATVNGETVHVDGTNGVRVDTSNVVSADVTASNGVIHVIDAVLLP